MDRLVYKKMSLFDAPEGANILHACNAKGVWGSGIAAEMRVRYPKAYAQYKQFCSEGNKVGQFLSSHWENHSVYSIITSYNYGSNVETPSKILVNTAIAISHLAAWGTSKGQDLVIYSNKFNSGLFKVSWKDTEYVILKVLEMCPGLTWIVCDPNMEE